MTLAHGIVYMYWREYTYGIDLHCTDEYIKSYIHRMAMDPPEAGRWLMHAHAFSLHCAMHNVHSARWQRHHWPIAMTSSLIKAMTST